MQATKELKNYQLQIIKILSEKILHKTLIIGLGLIGGSFAKALSQNKISNKIYAYDLNLEALEKAIKSEVISDFTQLEDNISDFDLIVLATPLSSYKKILAEISHKISPQTVIIDLGSLKEFITKILPANLSKNFIACHPIAGSEKTGFENSSAQLFKNKKFIICPENSDKNAVKKVTEIIEKIGANVAFLEAKKHDEIYALVSHLPQFISFLTKDFSPKKITDEFFKTAFRLDNSDAEIWSDIFKLNEKNLEKFYLEFFANLEKNIELYLNRLRPEDGVTSSLKTLSPLHSFLFLSQSRKTVSFPEKFLEENFAAIFFRAAIVASYLQISEIKNFQNYAGSGFQDFVSIITIFDFDQEKLAKLIQKNRSQILKLFNSIS